MTAAAQATAVIAAAGSGDRLGAGGPKALAEIAGRPLVAWCLDAFDTAESIGAIVVAAPRGHERELAALAPTGIRYEVVTGGPSRAESVANALACVDLDVVAVHDAARPLVTAALVDELVAVLADHPEATGVIAGAPITETVKRADRPRAPGGPATRLATIAGTESREHLWAAQTPQVFRAAALRGALEAGGESIASATDEALLVERAQGTVLIHPTSARNLKVTTPADRDVAELLLEHRGN